MAIFYVIATPIGNLEDVSLRSIRILKEVDLILCEDTRVTKRLLSKYDILTPTMSYHAQSRQVKIDSIFDEINKGKNIALVTDAGTPGISDPGSLLISEIREKFFLKIENGDMKIVSIPGPSAIISALSIAGVPTDSFVFLGFMPNKKGRETLFKEITLEGRTVVFYESNHRIVKTLESLKKHLSDTNKRVTIVREITKIFEEVIQGNAEEVLEKLMKDNNKQKGEFVVIVSL